MCTHIELTAGPGIGPVLSTGAAIAGGCWPWLAASAPRRGGGAVASASAGAGPGPPTDADADRPAAGIYAAQPVPGGLGRRFRLVPCAGIGAWPQETPNGAWSELPCGCGRCCSKAGPCACASWAVWDDCDLY
jgi:hypothetical protein